MNPSIQPEDSALLWKYIDGLCTPKEAQQLAQRLEKEAALKAEWMLRLQLNKSLKQLPMEQPSMRFAMNIMDRLPALVRKITIEPLISPRWLKAFWATMGVLVCTIIASVSGGEVANSSSSAIAKHVDEYTAFFQQLPYPHLLASMAIAFGLLALYAIERRWNQSLKKQG